MTDGNRNAYPFQLKDYLQPEYGLTKREYFAAMATCTESEIAGYTNDEVGYDPYKAEAKIKVMKADALINALNKPPQR